MPIITKLWYGEEISASQIDSNLHLLKSKLACQRKVCLRSRAPMSAAERAPVPML